MTAAPTGPMGTGMSKDGMDGAASEDIPVAGGPGNSALQRAINKEGV